MYMMTVQLGKIKQCVLIFNFISLSFSSFNLYAERGDVHARELAVYGLGFAGHMGIEYDEENVIDMGGYFINDYTPLKMISDVRWSKPEEFHGDMQTWGVRYLDEDASRAADLAWRTWFIGADYTVTTRYRKSQIMIDSRGRYVPVKGFYRCDTLVLESYKDAGYNIALPNPVPLLPYNIFHNGFPYDRLNGSL